MSSWENNEEIKLFQEFLRIPSVHPDPDYDECVNFLTRQAEDLGLPIKCYYPAHPKKPVVVMTWTGTEPELPSIVLNSHMDVVPVYPESWTHPPFAAEIDADGKIFARGSQDMKCVGMQYLAAIRALKKDGLTFRRTIHIMFVPDEEVSGGLGMMSFVKTDDFKSMNVAFSMDEGVPDPSSDFQIFFGERSMWTIKFTFTPTSGDDASKNCPWKKFQYFLNKLYDMRAHQLAILEETSSYANVTSINLTMIDGGNDNFEAPSKLTATFDLRLGLNVNHEDFEQKLNKWCNKVKGGVEMEFILKEPFVPATILDDNCTFWVEFKKAAEELNMVYKTTVFMASTDSQYLRELGISAIGFSPMTQTEIRAHDHDEYLGAEVYLRGIEIYKTIFSYIANAI